MSENFDNRLLPRMDRIKQLSVPVESNAPNPRGSICNFSRVSAPAVSSAWLLPSGSDTSLQPFSGSAYLYQQAGTTMSSGLLRQSNISTSASLSSGAFERQPSARSTGRSSSLGDVTVMILDQETSVSSMSMSAQCCEIPHANGILPLYSKLPASLAQRATSQTSHQGPSLSLPHQEGSQVYYYEQNTLGTLLCGELGSFLQSYGSVPYTGGGVGAPRPEMMMVLKEIHPTNIPPAVPPCGFYYSGPAQCIPETSFQVMEASQEMDTSPSLDTSLGLQTQSQTSSLPQTVQLTKSYTQIQESNQLSESADISIIPPVQSPSKFLALTPAPRKEPTERKNFNEIKPELSKLQEICQISKNNQDPPLQPFKISDICDTISSSGPVSQWNHHGSEKDNLGDSSPSKEEDWPLEDVLLPAIASADISILVEDVYLPQLFSPQTDLDLLKVSIPNNAKDTGAIEVNEIQVNANVMKGLPHTLGKNKEKVSEPIAVAPKTKIQCQNSERLVEGEVVVGNATACDRAPANTTKCSQHRADKATSSRPTKTKACGQEKTKIPKEKILKKVEELKQSRSKVKAEEKLAIPKTKRKGHLPELSQEAFKKPRSSLGMHILESVQVFHALGRKSEEKAEMSLSQALENTLGTKNIQLSSVIKSGLHIPQQGTGPEKSQGKGQKPEGIEKTECPSSYQGELPPPGKVKLVPLPFLSLDKPQAHSVHPRVPYLASRRVPVPDPAKPPNLAHPSTINPSQPAPAHTSLMGPTKKGASVCTSLSRAVFNNPAQPRVSKSAASKPAPYKTSFCTSLHKKPVSTAPTKPHSPPKPHSQYLLEDFSCQPIPWRKVDFPGPVVSTPIIDEQRPEIEAMKRLAQRERENAAMYTALGKVQYFVEKEKDKEIAQYFGCVL